MAEIGVERREFLKLAGLFLTQAACSPDKLFGPQLKVPRNFFGLMLQGDLLNSPDLIDIPIGTYRDWNNGASYEWVYRNNWEGFERAIRFAESRNAELLHVLAGEAETVLPTLADWRSYVSESVERSAGRIRLWEVWNEPVYAKALPQQMADYASEAYRIIKESAPQSTVLSPAFNELLTGYGYDFAAEYLDEQVSADAIAFHSYDGLHEIGAVLERVRGLTNLPLWNTETVNVLSLEPQARLGVSRVVLNGQVASYDYRGLYDRMAA